MLSYGVKQREGETPHIDGDGYIMLKLCHLKGYWTYTILADADCEGKHGHVN